MAIDPNDRPVRVINDDTTEQEMTAGHITPGADPPKNEDARGGFGNRDGKEGFGTDSSNGVTAVSMNQNEDKVAPPDDNMRTTDEGRPDRPTRTCPTDDLTCSSPAAPSMSWTATMPAAAPTKCRDPDSRVGMGQMERQPPTNADLARQGTNADLTDPDATDTAIVQ